MTIPAFLIASLLLAGGGGPHAAAPRPFMELPDPPDGKDDPALSMYKEGYQLVLAEKWDQARKRLEEMIAKYPKSEYADDAAYWSAYALMHTDRKAAEVEYKNFIKRYPKSNYRDDALADLNQLTTTIVMTAPPGTAAGAWSTSGGEGSGSGYGYGYAYGRDAERSLRDMERKLRNISGTRMARALRVMPAVPGAPGAPMAWSVAPRLAGTDEEKLDPETELKVEALYAIGTAKPDDKGFKTLKDVALDFSAARPLREAALDALSNFKNYDLVPVYTEIARRDTSAAMRELAIDFITTSVRDKNKSVGILIDLYNASPNAPVEQRRSLFYFIANVGNDRAVDFLAAVAKTEKDFSLRREAVAYLGNIGSERARAALYSILEEK